MTYIEIGPLALSAICVVGVLLSLCAVVKIASEGMAEKDKLRHKAEMLDKRYSSEAKLIESQANLEQAKATHLIVQSIVTAKASGLDMKGMTDMMRVSKENIQ